jgi:predicted phosphodiesterase
MRVAVLNDIHGNLPALDAVLENVHDAGVDRIVVGGDVLPGPMPIECLTRLLNLDVPVQCLHGNGDRVVHAAMTGGDYSEVPEAYRDQIRWNAQQLGPDHARVLAEWPLTISLDIPGLGAVLFCHASPRNDNADIFTRLSPDERLRPMFEGVSAALVVCGHTHMQFDRMFGALRLVNAGSVGMPFGEPGADWLLIGPDVQLRHTSYDRVGAADRIRRTEYPQADAFATNYVLNPPSEAQMLAAFTPA